MKNVSQSAKFDAEQHYLQKLPHSAVEQWGVGISNHCERQNSSRLLIETGRMGNPCRASRSRAHVERRVIVEVDRAPIFDVVLHASPSAAPERVLLKVVSGRYAQASSLANGQSDAKRDEQRATGAR